MECPSKIIIVFKGGNVFNMYNSREVMQISFPDDLKVTSAFTDIDYCDAYKIEIPQNMDVSIFVKKMFYPTPSWVSFLLYVRDSIMALFGLKSSKLNKFDGKNVAFLPGCKYGFFEIIEVFADEIIMGKNDKHLDYRFSAKVYDENGKRFVVVATIVHYNNRLGKAYFSVVKYFHKFIVKKMVADAL